MHIGGDRRSTKLCVVAQNPFNVDDLALYLLCITVPLDFVFLI